MTLIGPYPAIDIGDARPAERLDGDTADDLRAQRDAALGWLATIYAAYARQDAEADGARLRNRDVRALEDQAAASVWERITSAHERDDTVDRWRLISIRNDRRDAS